MGNQKSYFVRLYPFEKKEIKDILIDKIINELKPIFFDYACFYFSPNDRSYLDICFHYRNWLNDFFNSKLITDNFHIWVRRADEGNWHDYISFTSNRYVIENQVTLDECGSKWSKINLNDIQYNNSCLYKADKLSIYGETENAIIFVRNILSGSPLRGFYKQKEIELDSKLKWDMMLPIRYLASNFSEFDYAKNGGKVQNINIYETMNFQGHLSHAIIEDFSLTFNKEMKRLFSSENGDNEYDSIRSIGMTFKGRRVYQLHQDPITKVKEVHSWDGWDNCIDEEFIKFIAWYGK